MVQKQILLATYNGEKYLPQQLDSLLTQTDQDWKLLVRDDGSTDKSPQILERFASEHPDKIEIVHDFPNGVKNQNLGGPTQNFARLLKLSTAPYIMFCDQDDVWYPEKISASMAKMHEMEGKYGTKDSLCVHTGYKEVDKDGKKLNGSSNCNSVNFNDLLTANHFLGFSMTINRALAEEMQPVMSHHDTWAGVVCSLKGHIAYTQEPVADYRKHENNFTGVTFEPEKKQTFTERIKKRFKQGIFGTAKSMVDENTAFYHNKTTLPELLIREHGHDMGEPEYNAAKALIDLPNQGYFGQRVSMVKHGLLPKGDFETRVHRFILPIRPKIKEGQDNRAIDQILMQTPTISGKISGKQCDDQADALIGLLFYNRPEGGKDSYFKLIINQAQKIYLQEYNASKTDALKIQKEDLDQKVINNIVATAMKKFVQKAHITMDETGCSQWDDVSVGLDNQAVCDELTDYWIKSEIQDYLKSSKAKPSGKSGMVI